MAIKVSHCLHMLSLSEDRLGVTPEVAAAFAVRRSVRKASRVAGGQAARAGPVDSES